MTTPKTAEQINLPQVGKMEMVTRQDAALMPAEPSPTQILQAIVKGGITPENMATCEKALDICYRMEARNAEKEFAADFLQLQSELPVIFGCRPIPDKQGRTKFCYANFEDIDNIVRPICLRRGFTYGFRETGIENGRVTVTMTLQHRGGHSREIPYSVRVGSGPPGASESQADVSGHSYAQRGALESGLSLRIVGQRDDARDEGAPITPEQAEELRRRVQETGSDEKAFLRYAGAAHYEAIPSSKYSLLDASLRKKERTV